MEHDGSTLAAYALGALTPDEAPKPCVAMIPNAPKAVTKLAIVMGLSDGTPTSP